MKDMGNIQYFLGVEFKDLGDRVVLTQKNYVDKLIKKFNMQECRPISTPMLPGQDWSVSPSETVAVVLYKEAIGGLLYLSTRTRPDISFPVSLLARFASSPHEKHWKAVKRILRYLKGTHDFGLIYEKSLPRVQGIRGNIANMMYASSDADWASNCPERKSTSGMTVFLGNALVAWKTQKQKSVALSTSEAEYIALSDCAKEVRWIRELLRELGFNPTFPTKIEQDNTGAIAWSETEKRAKHVEIRYHFVRDLVRDDIVSVNYCPSRYMVSDIMTKPMARAKFEEMRKLLNLFEGNSEDKTGKEETVDSI